MISKRDLFKIVFGASTRSGRLFDVVLLWVILASVLVAILDSVPSIGMKNKGLLTTLELFFTIIFTIEYALRVYIVPNKKAYIFSFWGLVDVISFLPTYLGLIFVGYEYLIILRIVRLLRVFQVYQLTQFLLESRSLYTAFRTSIYKISIFMSLVLIIVILLGSLMFVIESEESGFTSIPQSIYWAIITITTVGYGDIVPVSVLGKFISSFIMLIGYSIIAVPTGIVTYEMTRMPGRRKSNYCAACDHENPKGSVYCNHCGGKLNHSGLH